jgi:hypothetical protein
MATLLDSVVSAIMFIQILAAAILFPFMGILMAVSGETAAQAMISRYIIWFEFLH